MENFLKKYKDNIIIVLIIILSLFTIQRINSQITEEEKVESISISLPQFQYLLDSGEIDSVYIDPEEKTFTAKRTLSKEETNKSGKTDETITEEVNIDSLIEKYGEDYETAFLKDIESVPVAKKYEIPTPDLAGFKTELLIRDVEVDYPDNTYNKIGLASLLFQILFIVVIIRFFMKSMPSTSNTISTTIPAIDFNDIAGNEALKEDMMQIVDFLKQPEKYNQIGAKMPNGVLFYGPPGTGKTLMAKAIAGTAEVPFYNVSGSDFIEMYVGLGAKRVRKLYDTAKKNAPCIVFIDEIDAIGGNRDNQSTHSEQKQTINAFLKELDGFSGETGVITIAATNYLESLDKALIRPGRFDKQIAVGYPEKSERLEILKIHAKGKKFDEDVKLEEIAEMTTSFSGAALASLLNQSAHNAIKNNREEITLKDIDEAFTLMSLKGLRKSTKDRDTDDLKLVAVHEAGHTLATKLLTKEKVSKVTVIPSTSGAGGVTFVPPEKMGLHSKSYIEKKIKIFYAGRAAEQIYFGNKTDITTGASNDIQQATKMIKSYINDYGMNDDVGLLNLAVLSGNSINGVGNETLLLEAKKMANKLYEEVIQLLNNNKKALMEIQNQLIEKESLKNDEIDKIIKDFS